MKFIVKNNLKENIYNLMRRTGYHFLRKDEEKQEFNFIRPLDSMGYPRLHLYLKINNENLIFNLHLDQKKPTYKDVPAHSGEHEGEIIEKEAERIKNSFILN